MADCNKIQANNLACNKISLTEQWKKGELPEGWYWVKKKTCEEYIDKVYFWDDIFLDGDVPLDNNKVVEVLAPVPSYEEYLSLTYAKEEDEKIIAEYEEENAQLKEYERIVTSYNMKPIDYDIACETVNKLLNDNKRLKHDVGNLGYKIKNQRHEIDNRLKEIEKLKELLKECKPYIALYTESNKHIGFTPETANLLQRINEVLK